MSNSPVEEQRQQLLEDARKIEECIQPLPPPRTSPALVVLSGLPGSGKSHFCRRLTARYPMASLKSDTLRKALFGQPTYSAEENRRLFSACHLVLSRLLARGIPAIFDATNLREMHRRQVADLVEALQTGREPYIAGAEGRHAIEIIEAIYLSHRQGQVVQLPVL